MDLCGHATLAAAHALCHTAAAACDASPAAAAATARILFHTRSGPLPVHPLGGGLYQLNFPAAAPEDMDAGMRTAVTPDAVAEALNLHSCTPHVAGRDSVGDTFAVFTDPQHVLAAVPDLQKIAALGGRQGLTLVHFSAQSQPFLTQNTPSTSPHAP